MEQLERDIETAKQATLQKKIDELPPSVPKRNYRRWDSNLTQREKDRIRKAEQRSKKRKETGSEKRSYEDLSGLTEEQKKARKREQKRQSQAAVQKKIDELHPPVPKRNYRQWDSNLTQREKDRIKKAEQRSKKRKETGSEKRSYEDLSSLTEEQKKARRREQKRQSQAHQRAKNKLKKTE